MRTRLFEILEAQGRSIAWLARRMGYSQNYLYLVKMGQRPVTEEFRRRACNVLQLPDTTLFFLHSDLTDVRESLTAVSTEVA